MASGVLYLMLFIIPSMDDKQMERHSALSAQFAQRAYIVIGLYHILCKAALDMHLKRDLKALDPLEKKHRRLRSSVKSYENFRASSFRLRALLC
jgi:hypothetical protein